MLKRGDRRPARLGQKLTRSVNGKSNKLRIAYGVTRTLAFADAVTGSALFPLTRPEAENNIAAQEAMGRSVAASAPATV